MSTTRAAVLATVERSPTAAAAHDRAGWVGLFTAGAQIEDPVGSRPHLGHAEIERFYDTFIGPRDITFHRDVDIVHGHTVLRDLVLEVAMGASMGPGVTMHIPAVLRYDVRPVGDDLRISRLQAYWELPPMVRRFVGNGPASLPAAAQLTTGLMRNQGPVGAVGFLSGLVGVGGREKRLVAAVVDDACTGDEMAVQRHLGPDAEIAEGETDRLRPSELVSALAGSRRRTLVAAGRYVAVSVVGPGTAAVLIVQLTSRPLRVQRIEVFREAT